VKKILILSANPLNTARLRLDEEVREIQAGLERAKSRDKFEIITRWAVRFQPLQMMIFSRFVMVGLFPPSCTSSPCH